MSVKFFHNDLGKSFLYGSHFVHGSRKGPSPNCCHKVGSTELSRMSLHAVALRFPFTGTKGPSPNHEKQPQPLFVLPQTLQWALYIHQSREPMVASFTPLQPMLAIAHGDLRLVCGCLAMETHFMKLPTNSYCADVASRGSLELGIECCNRGQTIFTR